MMVTQKLVLTRVVLRPVFLLMKTERVITTKKGTKMVRVSKTLKFCAAHRLYEYKGPCSNIHGHNYKVVVTVERPIWKDMVLDFSFIKKELQEYLDSAYDHALILNTLDPLLPAICQLDMKLKIATFDMSNPTAENMAVRFRKDFELVLCDRCPNVEVYSVCVYETDTSYAEAFGE
jgi:queuosine biosynthesis protein QueD